MKVIRFLLHTQQPILATSLQGDPNSDVSYPYIPGSMIRGMLIGRYCRQLQIQELDILDEKTRRLFFEDRTRYLNAYLFDPDKKHRTLPTPFCLYKEKGDDSLSEVFDFSQIHIEDRPESPQRLEYPFCILCILDEYSKISLYEIQRRINIHNKRDRKKGRGTEATGEVFRYDAIDSGQTFESVIICECDEDLKNIKSLLTDSKTAYVGGSRTAGYGHVTIDKVLEENDKVLEENNWNEIGIKWEDRSDRQNNLTITLLSDTIIRDECGQITTDSKRLISLISAQLKTELELIDAYANQTIVGGFNRKWGLPVPQVQAITAGSVFVFKCSENTLDSKAVKELENKGIGERRIDGFGRVALNWIPEESEIRITKENIKPKINPDTSSDQEQKLSEAIAKQMAERMLRKKLDEILIEQVSNTFDLLDKSKLNSIQKNQLSRLMIVTRNALNEVQAGLSEHEEHSLDKFLGKNEDSSQMTRAGKEQLKNIKMSNGNGRKFDKQLREWLKPSNDWLIPPWRSKYPNFFQDEKPMITIYNESAFIDSELQKEYTLRLILAITKKMMQEKKNV